MALAYRKPFAVVPCCVFPSLEPYGPRRRTPTGEKVTQLQDFIVWLQGLDPDGSIKTHHLEGMPGCNTVVYKFIYASTV